MPCINFYMEFISSSDTEQFLSLLDSFNYTQHIDDATHSRCRHTLDLIASLDNSSILYEKPAVIDTLTTDSVSGKALHHSALVCKLSLSLLSPKSHQINYRNSKNIDLESLSNKHSFSKSSYLFPLAKILMYRLNSTMIVSKMF